MTTPTANDPWNDGHAPHLPIRVGEVPDYFLLPGDPARVEIAGSLLEGFKIIGQRREFRYGAGSFRGVLVGVCSTGIGGPSTEIAIVELARAGAQVAIRTGGMGSVRADLSAGALGVVEAAERTTGTAALYLSTDQTAVPDDDVRDALFAAAQATGRPARRIRIRSTDSYYVGQGRAVLSEREGPGIPDGAYDGMDMETETVFAVGQNVGMRTGAVLGVRGNRIDGTWLLDYEPVQRDVVLAALLAISSI